MGNKPSTARGADGGLNRFKNLGKANQVVAERKAKRDDMSLLAVVGIKVSAMLWSLAEGPGAGRGKMVSVSVAI